jgi:hypothetical protein
MVPVTLKFEDTKGVIGSNKSKTDKQYNGKKSQTIIYQTLGRKQKI